MKKIIFTPAARADVRRIDRETAMRILTALDRFTRTQPPPRDSFELLFAGQVSLRGRHRISETKQDAGGAMAHFDESEQISNVS